MLHTTPSKHQEQAKDVQEEGGQHGPKHKALGHKGIVEDVRVASRSRSLCKPGGDPFRIQRGVEEELIVGRGLNPCREIRDERIRTFNKEFNPTAKT